MTVLLIISLVALYAYHRLISFYVAMWNELQEYSEEHISSVSVVIAFRDEAENLPGLLQSISELDYPADKLNFLFVNDHSSDASVKIIDEFQIPFEKSILHLKDKQGKKNAVQLAWKEVRSEVILHTDADCELPNAWVKRMCSHFVDPKIKFVSGPVAYPDSENFFGAWLQLDLVSLITIGAAHISWGNPLICNGANLAFRRDVLDDIDLYEKRASGDDVFLMQSIHNRYEGSVYFQKHRDAIVLTKAPENVNAFWNQRLRWAGKNTEYDDWLNTLFLAGSWLFNVIIVLNLILFNSVSVLLAIFMVIVKVLIESELYRETASFFGLRSWYKVHIFGQLFHIIYMVILPIASKLVRYSWKGRKLK